MSWLSIKHDLEKIMKMQNLKAVGLYITMKNVCVFLFLYNFFILILSQSVWIEHSSSTSNIKRIKLVKIFNLILNTAF